MAGWYRPPTPGEIWAPEEKQQRTIYFALAEYRDKLLDDLATCYNGSETYGSEDDAFLTRMLADVCDMMRGLEDAGLDLAAGRAVYGKVSEATRSKNAFKVYMESAS